MSAADADELVARRAALPEQVIQTYRRGKPSTLSWLSSGTVKSGSGPLADDGKQTLQISMSCIKWDKTCYDRSPPRELHFARRFQEKS